MAALTSADLRALLIGIVGGLITIYAGKWIDRYLARRTVRGRQRQIQQLTQELHLLEKLGVSDRSLLLFAFQLMFALIALAGVGSGGAMALSWISGPSDNGTRPILLLVSILIAIFAFYALSVLRKLEDPEPTFAKLSQRLRELQEPVDHDVPARKGGA